MKTAVIWTNISGDNRFHVLDGDLTRFADVFLNARDNHQVSQLRVELQEFWGRVPRLPVTLEEFAEAIRDGASVVECGYCS